MRVLHVIPSVAPRYGGPSQAVVGFCRALRAAGVQAEIATTNADGSGVLPVALRDRIRYEDVPTTFFARYGEGFKYSPGMARWLRRHVQDFDVVHVHAIYSYSSIAAGTVCRRAKVPYVLRPLGSLDPWARGHSAWKKRLLEIAAVRSLIAGAAAIHFMTDEERQLASDVTGRIPALVVSPGVDDELLAGKVGRFSGEPRIISLSRLDPSKRLEELIRAFHHASDCEDLRSWRLTIAGDGDPGYRQSLEALAKAGPAANRIEFIGWVSGEAKRTWLSRASLFALPSHQENFGLGLLEALACGVPAVMSHGVNLSRDVVAAGAGWTCGDESPLADVIRRAMRDAHGRMRASAAARHFAARFSWRDAGRALADQYTRIVYVPSGAVS